MPTNIMKYVVPTRRVATSRPRAVYRRRRRGMKRRVFKRRAPRAYTKIMRTPVPDRMFTKMRYSEGLDFTITLANTLYPYTFQSSTFDPDLSATGHQPLWRDTYAAMYNRYRVLGIGYRIHWRNTNTGQITIGFVQHNSVNVPDTNYNTLIERNNSKKVFLDGSGGSRTNILSGYMSVAKTHGLSRSQFFSDDAFDATAGANPTKMAYLTLYAMSRSAAATAQAHVELVYYVEWFDRYLTTGS